MAMMAVPKNMVTMPRKRRPRASAGEVFITSESLIYLMDAKNGSESSQLDENASILNDIVYENIKLKTKLSTTNRNAHRYIGGYSCSIRTKDILLNNDKNDANDTKAINEGSNCESQHVSIYIGKERFAR